MQQSRKPGSEITPCGRTEPHRAHRAWTTSEVGICPGVPAVNTAQPSPDFDTWVASFAPEQAKR
ncbi:hypothetical protein [Streptomyces chrestomyceticus]|uniref:hypothetical protein n=1 Tax=Streptomyces chrestomyceticus TaxID=68185 RepID=UPI0033DFD48C